MESVQQILAAAAVIALWVAWAIFFRYMIGPIINWFVRRDPAFDEVRRNMAERKKEYGADDPTVKEWEEIDGEVKL